MIEGAQQQKKITNQMTTANCLFIQDLFRWQKDNLVINNVYSSYFTVIVNNVIIYY